MGWQQGHPQPLLLRLLLPPARDGHSDPKELLRIPHQPSKEHPTAPFAGKGGISPISLCSICAAKASGWFRAGERHVAPGKDWEGSASGKRKWKDDVKEVLLESVIIKIINFQIILS